MLISHIAYQQLVKILLFTPIKKQLAALRNITFRTFRIKQRDGMSKFTVRI